MFLLVSVDTDHDHTVILNAVKNLLEMMQSFGY